MEYTRRIIDDTLDELLPDLAAISIEGPRAVGKTATARRRAQTVIDLDLPEVRDIVRADPTYITRSPTPVFIDEWQHVPEIWDRVRRAVDEDRSGARFILAGSALANDINLHSGAGRIIEFRMRPLSMAERALTTPTVRVADLFDGEGKAPIHGESPVTLQDYTNEIIRSGFPYARELPDRARRRWLDTYIDRVITHDFAEQGHRVRQPELLRGWLRGYAAATASSTAFSKIGADLEPGARAIPSRPTSIRFRDVLTSLFMLDQVDAWSEGKRIHARFSQAPKHFLADPALAARLLNLNEEKLLSATQPALNSADRTRLGDFFEALVALSLRTYAAANDAHLSHFRDHDGQREVDFVIHRGHAEAIGFEVKLKPSINDHDVRHLLWLKGRLGDQVADLVVITTGTTAYRRSDGVAVVPLALLTA